MPQVQAAKAAGIPVIASHYNGLEQSDIVKKYADGDVPIDYFKAGALLVDWAVVQTKGHMNALVLISTGPLSTDSMMAGITDELKHCDDCKTKVINVPVVDWGTRITPNVQSALLADPTVNYIIVIYDSMSQFVVPAVHDHRLAGPGQDRRVQRHAVRARPDPAGPGADGHRREPRLDRPCHHRLRRCAGVCGLPPVDDPKIPFYIFDEKNAKDAGTPPQLSQGYGDAYVDGYAKLWQLKSSSRQRRSGGARVRARPRRRC